MSYAYVGCRTTKERNARGKGLKVFEINDKTGDWNLIQCLKTEEENPSYQTLDNEGNFLYSVHGDKTKVSSYKILEDGTLSPLNMIEIGGKNPVFITADRTNRFLVVAALQGGAVYVIKRNEDGSLGEIVSETHLPGKKEGTVSFAIHPNNRYAYLINEKGNKMTYFGFDDVNGKLLPRQNLPTLPETYTGEGQASASLLDKNGEILIGSNRIHESIVLYRIDQETGYMKELGYYPAMGLTPRFITFNPDYSRFYMANEDSDTIIEMKLDSEQGRMEYTGRVIAAESPVCITFR